MCVYIYIYINPKVLFSYFAQNGIISVQHVHLLSTSEILHAVGFLRSFLMCLLTWTWAVSAYEITLSNIFCLTNENTIYKLPSSQLILSVLSIFLSIF